MRIAVFLEQEIRVGGGFQQAYSIVDYLSRHKINEVEYVFFVFSENNYSLLQKRGIECVRLKNNLRRFLHRALSKIVRNATGLLIPFQGYIDEVLSKHRIDLVYFLTPSIYAMGLKKHNYMITIWDQCHRDWVEFPEVRCNLEFERREFLYKNVLVKAVAVLVDAELSRQNMHLRYGVDLDRIYVVPFFPMEPDATDEVAFDVMEKYEITRPFLFYPAQFWEHKNHRYILEALSVLSKKGVSVDVVFVGNDYGSKAAVVQKAKELNIRERCHFLGFVPREDVVGLYKKALALVMPTYFGPTNIPPLEAFYYGCPVCYSDLPGLRDQVGEAAFLLNLNDPNSLVEVIEAIMNDLDIVEFKIMKGYRRLAEFSGGNFFAILSHILKNYMNITGDYPKYPKEGS